MGGSGLWITMATYIMLSMYKKTRIIYNYTKLLPHTCGVNEPPVCVYVYIYIYVCGDTTDKPGPRGRKLSNILYTAEKYLK